jgi:hypothetical protein
LVALIVGNDFLFARLRRNCTQTETQLVAENLCFYARIFFATQFSVAKKLGIALTIFVPSHKPPFGGFGVYPAYIFIMLFHINKELTLHYSLGNSVHTAAAKFIKKKIKTIQEKIIFLWIFF